MEKNGSEKQIRFYSTLILQKGIQIRHHCHMSILVCKKVYSFVRWPIGRALAVELSLNYPAIFVVIMGERLHAIQSSTRRRASTEMLSFVASIVVGFFPRKHLYIAICVRLARSRPAMKGWKS